jgi:hypothetical protein
MDRSISDRFVVLATLKRATSRPDFVMNLLEMWCCLLFRSLPLNALEEWIQGEEEFYLNVPSLNVALPLDNGDDKASKRAINWLKDARDPLARGYYTDVQSGRLRPRPSIRRPASLAAPKSTNTTILDYILGSEILWGMAMGASTTLGAFLIHRRLLKPLWQSFERK